MQHVGLPDVNKHLSQVFVVISTLERFPKKTEVASSQVNLWQYNCHN